MIAPVIQSYKFCDKISKKIEDNPTRTNDKEIIKVDIIVNPNSETISDDEGYNDSKLDNFCPVHSTEFLLSDPPKSVGKYSKRLMKSFNLVSDQEIF